MKTILINARTYFLPESNGEVMQLVEQAKQKNQKIAVRGAAHSFPLVETNETHADYLFIMLTYLDKITAFNKITGVVTVQAGCHLGLDPQDKTGVSNIENSLVYQLDPFDLKTGKRNQVPGWALPDLGGISHQTIGGFMATGSSGGATQYAFESAIISVDIIHHDGTRAKMRTFTRPQDGNDSDPFFGAAFVNLGLMGIVVSVTFQCVPAYNISGVDVTSNYDDCKIDGEEIDIFGPDNADKLSLKEFFNKPYYTRFLWWPQENVRIINFWKAKRTDAFTDWQSFKSIPYVEFQPILGSDTLPQKIAENLFLLIGNFPDWLVRIYNFFGFHEQTKDEIERFATRLSDFWLKLILKLVQPLNTQKNRPASFTDVWWNGLPMDNAASDTIATIWFTELWISIDQTQAVMLDLRNFFEKDSLNAGTFSTEIYAAGSNDFWLSPAYKTDVIRIDIFWLAEYENKPEDYYQLFWTNLAKYNYRPHWAKYLPSADGAQGYKYLQNLYPAWKQWSALRTEMDPLNLFLTDYWAEHLFGIKAKTT